MKKSGAAERTQPRRQATCWSTSAVGRFCEKWWMELAASNAHT